MTRLDQLVQYIERMRTEATQLNGYKICREWFEAGVPVEDAITWANLGRLPGEAAELIAAGQTPADIAAIEAAMSTGDRHEDAVQAVHLLEPNADPERIRAALANADQMAAERSAQPWGTPPDMPSAETVAISPERRAEIVATLNGGDEAEEVVWMGVDGNVMLARLADGTDLRLTPGEGWA